MRKSVVNPSHRTYPMYSESNKVMINWWAISRNKKYIYYRVQLDFHILISVPSIMHFQCFKPREIQNILNDLFFGKFTMFAIQLERKVKDWITFPLVEICWNILILVHSCRKMITRSDTQYFFENKDLETCVYTLQNVTQRRVAYS